MARNVTSSSLDNAMCTDVAAANNPAWFVEGGFILIIYLIIMMFWGITFICEEYGVPSLRKFCNRHQFSDAVTGSIFIGTGLSIPVFFIAIVGLFASNSAIGVGTVIGGNAFNHLITFPSSIYVSPLYTMKLDPVVFTREMLCYFLTTLLLIWVTQKQSLQYGFLSAFNKEQWQSCLSIYWFPSLILICVYIFYCFMNIYAEFVSIRFNQFIFATLGYSQSKNSEPTAEQELSNTNNSSPIDTEYGLSPTIQRGEEKIEGTNPTRNEQVDQDDVEIALSRRSESEKDKSNPLTPAEQELSNTNNSSPIDTEYGLSPTIQRGEEKIEGTNPTRNEQVDQDDVEIALSRRSESEKDKSNSQRELLQSEEDVVRNSAFDFNFNKSMISEKRRTGGVITPQKIAEEMFTLPDPLPEKIFYYMMYPMKLAIYLTVPDVRIPKHKDRPIIAFCITLIWLAIQSYILTISLTLIGNWWNINSAIMGLTVAAWAGNYPAHWSSLVVAKKGDSDIASCNVYGSNVFNNCIGLGLPWMLYCLAYNQQSYDALQDQGVVLSLILLLIIIVIHYIMALACNFVFTAWMIPMMVGMYIGFLTYLCYFLASNF